LKEIRSEKAKVVMFICNHCPYVKYIIDTLVLVSNEYTAKGISFVAISSNDVAQYPEDGPIR
jgi:thiol-disulfide isomerase/thioredoxin